VKIAKFGKPICECHISHAILGKMTFTLVCLTPFIVFAPSWGLILAVVGVYYGLKGGGRAPSP